MWRDPDTACVRRVVSPPGDAHLQLTVVDLPPGARASFPAEAYAFIRQQIWVQRGRLTFVEGTTRHDLRTGDCLQLGPPSRCTFANVTATACRYVVAVARR